LVVFWGGFELMFWGAFFNPYLGGGLELIFLGGIFLGSDLGGLFELAICATEHISSRRKNCSEFPALRFLLFPGRQALSVGRALDTFGSRHRKMARNGGKQQERAGATAAFEHGPKATTGRGRF
jgi:hypothetical protein